MLAGPGGVGDAGQAGQGAVAELAEGVQPGRERLGQRGLQGGAGLVPAGEHGRRACCLLAAGLVVSEPGGDQRVGIAAPAVQHDVGDGDAEGGHRRELPAPPVRRAGERAGARVLPGLAGDAWLCAEFVQDRDGYGRGRCRPVQGGNGRAGHRVDVVQVLLQGGRVPWLASCGEQRGDQAVDVLLRAQHTPAGGQRDGRGMR